MHNLSGRFFLARVVDSFEISCPLVMHVVRKFVTRDLAKDIESSSCVPRKVSRAVTGAVPGDLELGPRRGMAKQQSHRARHVPYMSRNEKKKKFKIDDGRGWKTGRSNTLGAWGDIPVTIAFSDARSLPRSANRNFFDKTFLR